ncbi:MULTISPECIES: DUF3098 domain-containing protein [Hymenobacter]|uniref:DUF3098 domain-containing protein n=1 Tax=Hymenobacter jejuensis TaxID=2502781 RepID=A0A5B8A1I2_9BACT|nr:MULTISPECIES: DUF3098 domain-containing protein [Hymenobacter]MBC6990425.1 DUF3098 domain-containing protein [Hymenobacter sp. BT491]QDA61148.1 DUF3098 domain-containing protein [Hymenobacter jejuensis]
MEQKQTPRFAFGRRNYQLMFVGLAILAAGFITMTLDSSDYGEGFLGITLGPILLIIGFGIEFWAIMTRPGSVPQPATDTATRTETATTTATPVTAPARPTYKRP